MSEKEKEEEEKMREILEKFEREITMKTEKAMEDKKNAEVAKI